MRHQSDLHDVSPLSSPSPSPHTLVGLEVFVAGGHLCTLEVFSPRLLCTEEKKSAAQVGTTATSTQIKMQDLLTKLKGFFLAYFFNVVVGFLELFKLGHICCWDILQLFKIWQLWTGQFSRQ